MNTYETIFIAASELPQDKIESSVEKVKSIIASSQGQVLSLELWGRRRLAYPIKRNRDGFYVYFLYSSPPEIPAVLDRYFRVTETILRGLTVKIDPRYLEKMRTQAKAPSLETQPASPRVEPASSPIASPDQSGETPENSASHKPEHHPKVSSEEKL